MNLMAKDDWRGFIALVMPMSSALINPWVVQPPRIDSVLTTPFGEPAQMVAKTETTPSEPGSAWTTLRTAAVFVASVCGPLTRNQERGLISCSTCGPD